MKKRIMVSLLTVALMLVSIPAQVWAEEECSHLRLLELSRSESVIGGYYHSYTAPDGSSKGCKVTKMAYTCYYQCRDCGANINASGTYENHETNHD